MSQPNLREIIKQEYKKCIDDPVYFMKKYVKIQHPVRGTISFDLFPFQEETLRLLIKNDLNIILKSRQMGISTLTAAYSLWLMTFHDDKNILCISITQETAKEIVTRVRFANDNLPTWLKVQCVEDNRLSLRLKNGSQIKAVSSAGTAGRSSALSLLILDEAAFIDNIEEIWLSSQYTLSTGGRAILLSCVTKDTYIFTDEGIKQVADFVPNNGKVGDYKIYKYNILGVNNLRNGVYFKNSGLVDTIKIKTKFGSLEGSKIHKLWAYKCKENRFDWYKLEDLTIDDYVSIQYGMNIWGNNDEISNFNLFKSYKIRKPLKYKTISTELSYLFGLYIACGSSYKIFNDVNQFTNGSITISCCDKDIVWVFDVLNLTYYTNDDINYTISSKDLIELFEYIGFDLSKKLNNNIIPTRLLEMSGKKTSFLLKGIFDGAGHSDNGNISLTSTSIELISQLRIVLNNFGILASHIQNCDTHRLEISGKHALKYFNTIGFCIQDKNKNKELLLKQTIVQNCIHDIIPNSLDLVNKLYENSNETFVSIKEKYGVCLESIVNKYDQHKVQNISKTDVCILYQNYKNTLTNEDVEYYDKIISDKINWSKISDITYSNQEVFDFSLQSTDEFWCHSVIYNGFIGHQTPNGVGNFFHKTWVSAEAKENEFCTISLPWHLHPERDLLWRDKQTELSGVKGAAQECDCNFSTSGNQVVSVDILEFYKKTYIKDPVERRGVNQELWIWDRVDYSKNYMIMADCARGDGGDYSSFHVIDVENLEQVAEYKGQLTTKDYGNLLVSIATEYNTALLIVENNNIGWATLQQIIDREYPNTFYSTPDLNVIDVDRTYSNKLNTHDKKLVPGFTTTGKNRPLIISKLECCFRERSLIIKSIRLYDELNVFVWNGPKAEAMRGYNDDLVMALSIGLWVRDTALKLRSEQIAYNTQLVSKISKVSSVLTIPKYIGETTDVQKTMEFDVSGKKESLTWLL